MPLTDTYRAELARLRGDEASLRQELNRHERDAARARESARRNQEAAARASLPSSKKSYLSSAERDQQKALDADKRVADLTRKLADNARAQANKQRSLDDAERTERQAADREADGRRRKEANHVRDMARARATAEQDAKRRQRREVEHAREVARVSQPVVRYVHVRAPQPERLRVLYLTANPGMDLRTDAEVRNVQQALRGSKYRDQVEVHQRPAATPQDLLDGINDVRPHVIHFSGHGDNTGLFFDNGSVDAPQSRDLSFDLLAEALDATDAPPTLLVLNACDTLNGAALILPAVPVVVAMSDSIPDTAAAVFAEQFYAAIASAQSVGAALKQARVRMKMALLDGSSELITQMTRDDVNVDDLILVKTSNDGIGSVA